MTGIDGMRAAVSGLLAFTATEEEVLLAAVRTVTEQGSATHWAAAPLIAHNTEFKRQQLARLEAVHRGQTLPTFPETDHESADVYRRFCDQPADQVARASQDATAALLDRFAATADEDLLDPSRNPWLGGRHLWLQVIVRGFWHPLGHLGDYYLGHDQSDMACALQAQAVATADHLAAPDAVLGMARYNLACVLTRAHHIDDAFGQLSTAVELNPDLLVNVRRDADLAALRDTGRLESMLGC